LGGKRVYIVLNKWDIFADEKTTTGQPLPDIQTWENLIEGEVGIKIPVVPTSSKGTGKFALTLFLESLVENKAIIRQERFQNAAINILKDAFSDLFNQTVETQKLGRKLTEIQTDKAEMVNRLENIKNQLSVKAEQDKQSSQQNAVLQAEKQKLKADNAEMVNRLENLKNQLSVKAEQDKQLNKKNADLQAEQQKLKADNIEMVNRLENLKNQLSVKAEQDRQSNQKNADLQAKNSKLKKEKQKLLELLEEKNKGFFSNIVNKYQNL
jgi:chromosome segregation ATPase